MMHAYIRAEDVYMTNPSSPESGNDKKFSDPWFRALAHFLSMTQLADWMPVNFGLCAHCMYWLPSMNFATD